MEFEELQKIWDTQNNQHLYVINEKALHKRIIAKKNQAIHIASFSEWLLIIVNTISGCLLLGMNIKNGAGFFMYVLAAWMFGSALYTFISRLRRLKKEGRFDRSMLGDLQHALAAASYQVRFSFIMRWNVLPFGVLILLSFWESGKPLWLGLLVALFFALVWYASGWEHRFYQSKKTELEALQKKLQEEGSGGN